MTLVVDSSSGGNGSTVTFEEVTVSGSFPEDTKTRRHFCWPVQVVPDAIQENRTVRKKNAVFWDVTPCSSCKSRRFGGT
jgi:hypothetical protein